MLLLLGPDKTQPCGIADYTHRLLLALQAETPSHFFSYTQALDTPELVSAQAILVQYEKGLMPSDQYLKQLAKRCRGKVYVIPHEVYAENPFAFPYSQIQANNALELILKQWLYRWRHRKDNVERNLQVAGCYAHKVIPLSDPTANILSQCTSPKNILPAIPLAMPDPNESVIESPIGNSKAIRDVFFIKPPQFLIGIFGFLNPANDYTLVFSALKELGPDFGLVLLGGDRGQGNLGEILEAQIQAAGLCSRIHITGYIEENSLAEHLNSCDGFICPFRFKSNTASILHLFALGKPIWASDISINRYLLKQGAPLSLYRDEEDLINSIQSMASGVFKKPIHRYPWTFKQVAKAYIQAMGISN